MAEMTDYEIGYRECVSGSMEKAVEDHWSGKMRLHMPEDWFVGYQDATDDLKWRAMGCEQMQFGL